MDEMADEQVLTRKDLSENQRVRVPLNTSAYCDAIINAGPTLLLQ
jgi:hypothetical protein